MRPVLEEDDVGGAVSGEGEDAGVAGGGGGADNFATTVAVGSAIWMVFWREVASAVPPANVTVN